MPQTIGGEFGRYELHGAIARGGMATVHVARMSGGAGFARTVAVKRLHPHLAADPSFVAMFVDEARLAARIRHPNVIDTLDVVVDGGELFLVMAFVLGETLARLVRAATAQSIRLPPAIVSSIVIGALDGLHAAHEATNEQGEPLGIVHRDVSPQNILVGRDGVVRVIDFGVAKAAGRMQETEGGELKGKLAYMAPEQLTRKEVDRRCDVFAMGVVLWEALTSRRLFAGDDAASTLYSVLNDPIPAPSSMAMELPPSLDAVVLRALQRDPAERFATARDMALALEAALAHAPTRQTGEWVERLAAEALLGRAEMVRAVEQATSSSSIAAFPQRGLDEPGAQTGPTGSQRLRAPSSATHSVVSTVSNVTGHTGTSGVTASGYADPSLMAEWRAPPAPPERRLGTSTLIGICALLAVLLAVGLITGITALTRKPSVVAAAVAAPPSALAPSTIVAPVIPSPVPLPPATATTEPVAPAASPVAAKVAAAPTHVSPPAVKTPATAAKAQPTAKSATTDCDNPFIIDAAGVKRPKPQCFGH